MERMILRRREVEQQTQLSKATLYRMISSGAFPRPIKLGERAVGWRRKDIEDWFASREPAGTVNPSPEDQSTLPSSCP